jgi:steroid delta-isomerase-like uncharacterized protein
MRTRAIVPAMSFLLMAVGCAASSSGELDANKDLVREFTEATNAADWDGLAEIVTEDLIRHSAGTSGPSVTSRDEFIDLQKGFLTSFPDQHVRLEQLVAEKNFVSARATYSGTQTGPMGDFPATGKQVQAPFLALFRIESGKIAELWVEWDNLAMLKQLGLFPQSRTGSSK